jgi:hypothetical protein
MQRRVLYQLWRRLLDEGAGVEQQRDAGRKGYVMPGRSATSPRRWPGPQGKTVSEPTA